MKLVSLIFLHLLLIGHSNGRRIKQERVIGGSPVSIKNFPYTASLIIKSDLLSDPENFGGGSAIISKRWAITAAHCVEEFVDTFIPSRHMFVRGNATVWDASGGQDGHYIDHVILEAYIHEQYDPDTNDYDIALLQVAEPFTGKYEKPIAIADRRFRYMDGSTAVVLGWGTTIPKVQPFTVPKLRAVDVDLVNYNKCEKSYRKIKEFLSPRMVCAGAPGKDACINDSGGPLVQHKVLIAIKPSTYNNICTSANYSGWYYYKFKMGHFHFWIALYALATWTVVGQQLPTYWATRNSQVCKSTNIFSRRDESHGFVCANIKKTKFIACIRRRCKDGQEGFIAGAAIIHRYWTITAAHPLNRVPIKLIKQGQLFVYSNTHIWNQLGLKHKVAKVCIHRNFTKYKKKNLDYDVALVKVRQPFRGVYEKPIRLPPQVYEYKDESTATVLGWGSVYWHSEILRDDKLRQKNTSLIEYFKCQRIFGDTSTVVPYRMFCAEVPFHDPCMYDPGSPIFQNGILIGVASWTVSHCADTDKPMLFTRLSMFHQWIEYKLAAEKKRSENVTTWL